MSQRERGRHLASYSGRTRERMHIRGLTLCTHYPCPGKWHTSTHAAADDDDATHTHMEKKE